MFQIQNNSTEDVTHLTDIIEKFLPYSQKKLGFHKPVMLSFQSDEKNANRILGRTAFYDPAAFSVTVYITGRHPKDVLRSLSHELVHHAQNCRGDFSESDNMEQGYAQKDPHMRDMELEAYEKGNIIFRDFEDLIKAGKINITLTGEPKMTLKEWKDNELNMLLMKKWGLLKETKDAGGKIVGEAWSSGPEAVRQRHGESPMPPMANSPAYHRENVPCDGSGNKRPDWVGKKGRPVEPCPEDIEDLKKLDEDREEGELTEWAPGHEPPGSTHDFLGNPLSSAPKGTKPKNTRWYAGDSKPSEREEPEDEDEALEKRRERQRWRIAHGFAEGQEPDERVLTLEEARDVARRIFERIQKEL